MSTSWLSSQERLKTCHIQYYFDRSLPNFVLLAWTTRTNRHTHTRTRHLSWKLLSDKQTGTSSRKETQSTYSLEPSILDPVSYLRLLTHIKETGFKWPSVQHIHRRPSSKPSPNQWITDSCTPTPSLNSEDKIKVKQNQANKFFICHWQISNTSKPRQDLPNLYFIGRATCLWKIHSTKANTC